MRGGGQQGAPEGEILAQEKRAARAKARAVLSGLSGHCAAGKAMGDCLAGLEAYRRAKVVLAFVPMKNEPDISPFLARVLADGKLLCLPVCVGPGRMQARRADSLACLAPGAYGILEPQGQLVRPEEIGFVVAPCLAAGSNGTRLGRGAGFYDRFLPGLTPGTPVAALCRAALVWPTVPAGPQDVRMDLIVTERGLAGGAKMKGRFEDAGISL